MVKASSLTLAAALCLAFPAYAQNVAKPPTPGQVIHTDKQAITQDYRTLDTDDDEIRALDRQRDEALRSNNAAAAQKLQAEIDRKRAARRAVKSDIHKDESDIDREKRLAAGQCARNPQCAAQKKREEIAHRLNSLHQRLAADEAAAARIAQDKAEIAKTEAEMAK